MDRRSRSRSRSRSPSSPRGGRDYRRDDFRAGRDRNDHDGFGAGGGGDHQRNTREKDRDRERQRRERMARMRAENEAEERGDLTGSTTTSTADHGGVIGNTNGDGVAKRRIPEQRSRGKSGGEDNDDDEEANSGDDDDNEEQMMQMIGFGGFGTTKGKAVADNQSSAARGAASKNKGRKYRQYMNRKGGFNRPLDKMN
ncbi:hypothetical protein ACHAXR_001736 [Thalassiosira sp. AJA248-18]